MNPSGAINEASTGDPLQSFREWQKASAIRRVAEASGADNDVVRLPLEVVRTRSALILERARAG